MTDVLDEVMGDVEAASEKRRRSAEAAWRTMVRDVATGTRPTAERLDKVMQAAGKSADDLRAAVLAHQDRIRDAEAVAAGAALAAERPAVAEKLDALLAELHAAQVRYSTAAGPLSQRLAVIDAGQRAAADAEHRLARDCPHPELVADLSANRYQQAELGRRIVACRFAAGELERAAQLRADVAEYRKGVRGSSTTPGVDPTFVWEQEATAIEQNGRGAAEAVADGERALAALRAKEPELVRRVMAV